MNEVQRLFKKWGHRRKQRALAKKTVHCIVCGGSLGIKLKDYLVYTRIHGTRDIPSCGKCQEKLSEAGIYDEDQIAQIKT